MEKINNRINTTHFDFKTWRHQHRLTQEKVASILGITSRQIQKYESGQTKPDRRTELACHYLGLKNMKPNLPTDFHLREWRRRQNLTMALTAKLLGISVRQVANIEQGKSPHDTRLLMSCQMIDDELELMRRETMMETA